MGTPHKGTLNPNKLENPNKYQGDVNKVVYRSSWEREVFLWCDRNPYVLEWASEELYIPYEHPIKGRRARYYPDLWIKMKDGTQRVVEIKPKQQTVQPETPKRRTQKYLNEVSTWLVNSEKWKSARTICEKNNLKFEIWTEEELAELGLLKTQAKRDPLEVHKTRPKLQPVRQKITKPPRPRPKRKS